jgi:hypothetical protein
MFDPEEKDLAQTLSQMERQARERSNFNQLEAKERMARWVANDRRFDGYDAEKLVERVQYCKSNGAALNLDSPELKRGQSRNRY